MSPWLLWAVVAIGILFRLEIYLDNPSFWLDETYVATQITSRSFSQIFFNYVLLTGQPESPMLFSILAKLSVLIFGNHELALRLVPFLSSSAALVLFAFFLKRYCSSGVALLAVALFAFNTNLIYFAAELKTYSGDVLTAVGLLWFLRWSREEKNLALVLLRGGYVGCLAMLFSNITLFFLPWLGILFYWRVKRDPSPRFQRLLVTVVCSWTIVFLYLYFSVYNGMTDNHPLVEMWKHLGGFSPKPLLSGGWWLWLVERYVIMARFLLPGVWPLITLILALVGLARITEKDAFGAFCLAGPVDLVLLAAILMKYPFYDRMILFLAPCFLLCVSEGVRALWDQRLSRTLAIVLIPVLLAWSVRASVMNARGNDEKHIEDNREVFSYLGRHMSPGDQLVLNNEAGFPFMYYFTTDLFKRFHLEAGEARIEVKFLKILDSEKAFRREGFFFYIFEKSIFEHGSYKTSLLQLKQYPFSDQIRPKLAGGRTWILLSHFKKSFGEVLDIMDRYGTRIGQFEAKGAGVYLYDMR
ncbi:MAG TPA: glycosyltransferase family 39 protein [Candidatus Omnitrophota bacterium]|nr:glycosyltransferase family 39 protein [Candidatus Omnitrophota bacterium]